MSVRLRKWKDKEGKPHEEWMVDVAFEHPDGHVERLRKHSPVSTRRGAEQYERELRQSMLHGISRKEQDKIEVPTLEEFQARFLKQATIDQNKHSTVISKNQILRDHLIPAFGSIRLDEVDESAINDFVEDKLDDGLNPKTVNNLLAVLSKLLGLARDRKLIDRIPRVDWLKTQPKDFDFLDFHAGEDTRFLAAAAPKWLPMFTVAIRTGLRLGELLALRWDCVDLANGRLIVRRNVWRGVGGLPKGGRTREVPLSDDAIRAFQSQPRHLHSPHVFHDQNGEALTDGECKWPIWTTCSTAGIRRIGWHVLRHTFASHLVMRGVPLKAVQELMGHATMEMTMRYSHLSPTVKRDAVKLLDLPAPANGTLAAHSVRDSTSA